MLTEEQIQLLDQFCQKKGAYYYDLRMELVDHLATEVEAEMQKDPATDFSSLVSTVFETFGQKGFQSIIQAKEDSVQDMYARCQRTYFWSFFTLPKIILTILIAVCLFLPFLHADQKEILRIQRIYFLISIVICLLTIFGILFQPGRARMPLLLLSWVKRMSLVRNILLFPSLLLNMRTIMRNDLPVFITPAFEASLTVILTVLIILTCIARYHAVLKMYAKAKKEYPLAFVEKTV